MAIEADCFMVFQGWDIQTTADMSLTELMHWHALAVERQTAINAQLTS
ncbi:GpE family phage tail protein [Spartinivicinus poritis]